MAGCYCGGGRPSRIVTDSACIAVSDRRSVAARALVVSAVLHALGRARGRAWHSRPTSRSSPSSSTSSSRRRRRSRGAARRGREAAQPKPAPSRRSRRRRRTSRSRRSRRRRRRSTRASMRRSTHRSMRAAKRSSRSRDAAVDAAADRCRGRCRGRCGAPTTADRRGARRWSALGSATAASRIGAARIVAAARPRPASRLRLGSGSGSAMDDRPAVDGAPTTAGTAANLLAYFPAGPRRDARSSASIACAAPSGRRATEALLRADARLPRAVRRPRRRHRRQARHCSSISTPRPRDATATTLVAHTQLARRQIRDLLASADADHVVDRDAAACSASAAASCSPDDKRVFLSPWKGWFVLAQPEDLGGLVAAGARQRSTRSRRAAKLPAWLDAIRTIENGVRRRPARGPALVVTLGVATASAIDVAATSGSA